MKAANTLVTSNGTPKSGANAWTSLVQSVEMQDMFKKSLGSEAKVARFTASLMTMLDRTPALKDCDYPSVIAAALSGEAMNLSVALGQYHVTPYGNKAVGSPSYKGYIQLGMRSGLYADLDVIEVKQGEYKGRDKRTGKPILEFMDDEDVREAAPVVGYMAYFELKDGFFRSEYWSMEKILKHADRYSKAFNMELFKKAQKGEKLTDSEMRSMSGPWYTANDKMCAKTVILQLLRSGYAPLSIEMESAMIKDEKQESEISYVRNEVPANVDMETGEVLTEAPSEEKSATQNEAEALFD